MIARADSICSHCGISFRWPAIEDTDADGKPLGFCCRGCQGAWQLITGAGLAQFYQRTDRQTPTVGDDLEVHYRDEDLARFVVPEGDVCRFDTLISGITCPSCVWLLERVLGGLDGVDRVSMSYSGGIASLRIDPQQITPRDIFAAIRRLGYQPRPYSPEQSEKDARRERDDLLLRFGTALFLTMQLMAYSYSLYAGYFQGMSNSIKTLLQYVSLLVTTPVVFYCGWPFLAGAWRSVKGRAPGMDLLIAVGALSAWSYSTWATFSGHETYFESAAMIVTFILIGRLLELSVRRKAMSGIGALYEATPQRAVLTGDLAGEREIPVADVRPGDLLLVRQGERFPVDCLIVEGETEIDQSMLTGESIPLLVRPGDEARAGCINSAAGVVAQALRPVGQSFVMRVAALVQMAQAGKPGLQQLADRVAGWFVPAVMLLALADWLWRILIMGQGGGAALMATLAVVLIACPCAMGLAVPAAVLAACSRSASLGIILRGGDVIERLATVTDLLLDKTGTITWGKPEVAGVVIDTGLEAGDCLAVAATIEHPAAHPLARAIVAHAAEAGYLPGRCREFHAIPGRGVRAILDDNRSACCGSPAFLASEGIAAQLPANLNAPAGATIVQLAIDNRLAATFALVDQLRPGAAVMVSDLAAAGVKPVIISGDASPVVADIAARIGVSESRGEMTPDAKLAEVQALQGQGRRVMMAGDGVNDSPALAAADVSCSLTGASDIALEQADVIIVGDDLQRMAASVHLARATMAVIKQNLAWAFVYNLIGIPLAVAGLLTPVYAAVAMTASSLLVSLNSLRLMRFKHHG